MLICSSGGHLKEMQIISKALYDIPFFLVTYEEKFKNVSLGEKKSYFIKNFIVDKVASIKVVRIFYLIIQFVYSSIRQLKIILDEQPNVIISTGSEIAISSFFLAKLLNIRTIYIESVSRMHQLSGTGKIVKIMVNQFVVQWDMLAKKASNNLFFGNVLDAISSDNKDRSNNCGYIFVSVGTAPFDRLISDINDLTDEFDYKFVIQTANSKIIPKKNIYANFFDYENMKELMNNCSIVICHSGVGTIMMALESGKPLILYPRKKKNGEVGDDHQVEISEYLVKKERAYLAEDYATLVDSIQAILKMDLPLSSPNSSNEFISGVRNILLGNVD
jgi:UDP-N-acetylglucosamine:LPS N-acetylglucosamine transferase